MIRAAMLSLALAVCSTLACAHGPTPEPTPVGATCADVCAHGAALGCTWATPTPAGATCAKVCQHSSAVGEPWDLACLSQVTSCDPTVCH